MFICAFETFLICSKTFALSVTLTSAYTRVPSMAYLHMLLNKFSITRHILRLSA